MSGGAVDYVMGMYMPNPIPSTGISDASGYSSTTTDSQYNLLTINTKYYDRYLTPSSSTGAIKGDATKETVGWYGDYTGFVSAGGPWFIRGGSYSSGAGAAGAWYFNSHSGGVDGNASFRVVLGPQA
jgi:nitrate reductase beta subunit